MLTNVMLYWLAGTAGSAARLYYENVPVPRTWDQAPGTTPTGVAAFAEDIAIRRLGEQANNIVHWSDIDQGGHFAGMEAPSASSPTSGPSSAACDNSAPGGDGVTSPPTGHLCR